METIEQRWAVGAKVDGVWKLFHRWSWRADWPTYWSGLAKGLPVVTFETRAEARKAKKELRRCYCGAACVVRVTVTTKIEEA